MTTQSRVLEVLRIIMITIAVIVAIVLLALGVMAARGDSITIDLRSPERINVSQPPKPQPIVNTAPPTDPADTPPAPTARFRFAN